MPAAVPLCGIVDAGPDGVLDEGAVVQVEPEMRRQQIGLFGERRPPDRYDLVKVANLALPVAVSSKRRS